MKVLLGIGGTDDSFRALDRTVERAIVADDDVVVGILETPDAPRSPRDVLERVEKTLADVDVDVEVRRIEGDPGSELVDIASREGFDEIVLGGGQTTPLGKITLGSVAEFVLLNAKTTVTLVR